MNTLARRNYLKFERLDGFAYSFSLPKTLINWLEPIIVLFLSALSDGTHSLLTH